MRSIAAMTGLVLITIFSMVVATSLYHAFDISNARPDIVLPVVFYTALRRRWLPALGYVLGLSYIQDVFSGIHAGFHFPAYLAVFAAVRSINTMIDMRPAKVKAAVGALVSLISRFVLVVTAGTAMKSSMLVLLAAEAHRIAWLVSAAAILVPLFFKLFSRLDNALSRGTSGFDYDIPREARRLTTGRILLPDERPRRS